MISVLSTLAVLLVLLLAVRGIGRVRWLYKRIPEWWKRWKFPRLGFRDTDRQGDSREEEALLGS
jgi:hypothetical protein